MTSITNIASGDLITDSRADINTNFTNLNSDKIETSILSTDTTLGSDSDTDIVSEKAIKAYVDGVGTATATTTVKGIVEVGTQTEVDAGTATGSTGASLIVTPATLAGNKLAIQIPDGAAYTVLAANSGKVHLILNQAQDATMTLPTAAAGLYYEFWHTMEAADGHDWLFVTGSDTYFYKGGIIFNDSDAADGIDLLSAPNGTDDATLQINLPSVSTYIKLYCDGTNWFINGRVFSTTAPSWT